MLALSNPSGAAGIVPWPCVGVLQARQRHQRGGSQDAQRHEDRTVQIAEDGDHSEFCKLNRSNPWT